MRKLAVLVCNELALNLLFTEGAFEGVGWGGRISFCLCLMRSYCMFVCQGWDLRCGLTRFDIPLQRKAHRVLVDSKEGDTLTHTAGAGPDWAGRPSRLATS